MAENSDLERFLPGMSGRLAYEHVHRYAFSQKFVAGKRVLDVACGSGYGTAMLSTSAAHIVGLDRDPDAVGKARRDYADRPNCMFITGDSTKLPFADGEFDVVVSFETLEHVAGYEVMASELARVLKKDGLLLLSTPNQPIYSPPGSRPNPYHVKEFNAVELMELLGRHFAFGKLLGQRFVLASSIGTAGPCAGDAGGLAENGDECYEALTRRCSAGIEISNSAAALEDPQYLVVFCAKVPDRLPDVAASIYIDPKDDLWEEQLALIKWAEDLKVEEAKLRSRNIELEQAVASLRSDLESKRNEVETLRHVLDLNQRRLGLLEEEGRAQSRTMAEVVHRSGQLSAFVGSIQTEIAHEHSNRQQLLSQGADEKALRHRIEIELSAARAELEVRKQAAELAERNHAGQLAQIERRLETLETENAKKLSQVAEQEQVLRDRLEARAREVESLKKRLGDATGKEQFLNQRLELQQRDAEGLREKLAANSSKEGTLLARLDEVGKELASAKARLAAAEERALGAAAAAMSRENAALLAKLEELGNQVAAASSKLEAAEKRALDTAAEAKASDKSADVADQIARIERVLTKLDSNTSGLEQQLALDRKNREILEGKSAVLAAAGLFKTEPASDPLPFAGEQMNGATVYGHGVAANDADSDGLRIQLRDARARLFERAVYLAEYNRKFAEHNLPNPTLPVVLPAHVEPPAHDVFSDSIPEILPEPALVKAPASPDVRLNGSARPSAGAMSGEAGKQRFRADCRRALAEFLAGSERIVLPTSAEPRVSIVMVLYNQAELTFECLRTMAPALDVPSEIIIVDNASTDETAQLCDRITGARIIRSGENLHFLRGVNRGTEECRGDAILLLNNDTTIKPGSLSAALKRLDEENDVGAVGGKIVLIDGTLQEAGSIIWSDGSCLGYGRGRLPREPEFSFSRDVDYCSGAFLLIRRQVFEDLNKLDLAFAPAYYEETDLCMRIRGAGYRVVYDPNVEIKHFEFGSSSSSEKAIELQKRNHKIFVERHRAVLQRDHLPPGSRPLDARMKPLRKGRLLVLDDRLPNPQLGQGFPRALSIHEMLLDRGWFLTFYPTSFPGIDWSEAYRLYPREVEIASDLGRGGLKAFLTKRANYYDAMVVSRPHNMELVNSLVEQDPKLLGRTKIIYDAEALVAPREAMKRAMLGRPVPESEQARAVAKEVKLGRSASAILAVNEAEAEHFRSGVDCPVSVIGHALKIEPTATAFADRDGFLFVGALDADDTPNVDSLVWFVKEIMPKIDRLIGDSWVLRAAGTNRSARAKSLAGPRVKLLGRVEDLQSLYASARVFVAPTRFAAGIPMKVHEAAGAGVPCVVTPLLARQLNWTDGRDLVAGGTAEEFAQACASLYTDQTRWEAVREAALDSIRADCDHEAIESKLDGVMNTIEVIR